MARGDIAIEVQGLREMQRAVRQAKDADLTKAMKKTNKEAADVVVGPGKSKAPQVSGKLAASVKSSNSVRHASIKAGTAARVPYAGPIHWGWAKRNIAPNPFLDEAIKQHWKEIERVYEDGIRAVGALLESKKG